MFSLDDARARSSAPAAAAGGAAASPVSATSRATGSHEARRPGAAVSCMVFVLSLWNGASPAHDIGVEADAAIDLLLVDALDLVVEAGEPVERLLEGQEVVEH